MLNVLALYRGETLGEVKTLAATSDFEIIKEFVRSFLRKEIGNNSDPSFSAKNKGILEALENILNEEKGVREELEAILKEDGENE